MSVLHQPPDIHQGPAVVVGTDEGAVYAWDLSGHDKGQIYAEMRSLSPMEAPSFQVGEGMSKHLMMFGC